MALVELVELDRAEGWPLWRAARLAALADAPDAFPGASAEWADGGETRWRERLLDTIALKVVAVRDGMPVGLVRGVVEDGCAWLHSLWVSPQVRGQGLGNRLVAAVEEWATRQGATYIRLEVVPGNAPAIALYRRHGYVDTGILGELLPDGDRELVMEKSFRKDARVPVLDCCKPLQPEGFPMTADRSQAQGEPGQKTPDETAGTGIDTTVPHSGRIWNYWLGGKDHYQVDRMAGDQFSAIYPGIVDIARADRAFLGRVVRFLAGEAGLRQFLDVGAGLPTADNTHEVAQRVAPESRIVYVDNDPLVLTHARALLTSSPEGRTHYADADMGDPENVLQEAAKWLDLTQPVGLTMMGVLGHVTDYAQARSIVTGLMDGLPAGSYLAINDSINTSEALEEALRQYEASGAVPYRTRSLEEFTGYFDGLDLVEPGVVLVADWRPDPDASRGPEIPQVGAVGCKR